jgi:uncharacterized membrane protein YphA (DoxX/SURF4 family)
MHPNIAATLLFFEFSSTAVSMSFAGIVLFLIAFWAVRRDLANAAALDKIVLLGNLCFAIPLAIFGAEHLSAAKSIMNGVPSYMPWRLFWAYFVGFALIAASLSIATKIQVRWSGLLFGIMMFLFVVMLHIPTALAEPHNRFRWAVVIRELSFGGAGWVLAGTAMGRERTSGKSLIAIGRLLIGIVALGYGIEHFLHPLGMPGVPLEKEMPAWIPARLLIDYLTGAFLVAGGVCFLLGQKTRMAATYLGGWIVLMVVIIYTPVMIAALLDPSTAVKVEGLNYFGDTLLFGGAILTLAGATPAPAEVLSPASTQPQPV